MGNLKFLVNLDTFAFRGMDHVSDLSRELDASIKHPMNVVPRAKPFVSHLKTVKECIDDYNLYHPIHPAVSNSAYVSKLEAIAK